MKWLLLVVFASIFLAGTGYFALQQMNDTEQAASVTPTRAPHISPTAEPEVSTVVNSPTASMSETGTISGKLCYPSEVLPAGSIEAKRTTDNVIVLQDYPGSQNGGGNTYSIELEPGTYVVRYKAGTLYGYQTDNCLTGLETTCGDDSGMTAVTVDLSADESIADYNLCNFYHTETNEPEF